MSRQSRINRATETSNPFIGVLKGLVDQINQGRITPKLEQALIAQAAYFAARNSLSFTPTLMGVVKMAETAEKLHRDHMAAVAARQRGRNQVQLTGFDHATGFSA